MKKKKLKVEKFTNTEIGNKNTEFKLDHISLSEEERKCAQILNKLYSTHGLNFNVEKLLLGAKYTASKHEENSDWMAQSCNSLIELLYPLTPNKEWAFAKGGYVLPNKLATVNVSYNEFSDLTHHKVSNRHPSEDIVYFDSLYKRFINAIQQASELQLDIHKAINEKIKKGATLKGTEVNSLKQILSLNNDSKDYFFHNTNHTWLAWLYERGFLDILKEPAQNPTSFSYRTPEVSYLVRMASVPEVQGLVAKIVLDTPISKKTFNPEVVDQFFWICTKLTAEHLAKIIPKIYADGWLRLMADVGYDSARYAFDDIFKILTSAGKFDEAILLAQEILSVAPKVEKGPMPEDLVEQRAWADKQKIFYCSNIADTGVFGILEYKFPVEQNIQVLTFLINTLTEIITKLGDRNTAGLFEYNNDELSFDRNHFFDVKEPQMRREFGSYDDIDAFFSVITWFTNRIFNEKANPKDMRQAWEVIETLPDAEVTYKIKLFAATRRPAVFAEEIKSLIFKLFETKSDIENIKKVLGYTEYHEALRGSFGVVEWKHDYTKELFPFFTKLIQDTNVANDKKLFQIELSYICSTILKYLTPAEVRACVDLTGKELIQNFDPANNRSGVVTSGTVVHEPPMPISELDKFSFSELIEKLKNEWSPEQIEKKKIGKQLVYENMDPVDWVII